MSLLDKILGRPLALSERAKESLSIWTGVPVLGLDALASTGYGPEAALTILVPLGLAGLQYFPIIAVIILIELTTLYLSYRQTAAAYPGGGGAYIVASDNLGTNPGVLSAVMLLLDYLLNVCVGISAGIGAVVSAIPALHPYHPAALSLGSNNANFSQSARHSRIGPGLHHPGDHIYCVYGSCHCYRAAQRLAERRPPPRRRGAS